MSLNFPKTKLIHMKIACDIYFNKSDLTTLRWLSEVKHVINPLEPVITVSFIKSNSNSIAFNKKDISLHDLKRVIFELAIEMSEQAKDFEKSIISS